MPKKQLIPQRWRKSKIRQWSSCFMSNKGKILQELSHALRNSQIGERTMMNKEKNLAEGRQHSFLLFASAILILSILIPSGLVGCGPSTADLEAVDYIPLPGDDWKVSTPAEQGLDPKLVAELYHNAAELETLYGLVVVKNGHLIAEKYFNAGAVD
jgi:hypothetical protein